MPVKGGVSCFSCLGRQPVVRWTAQRELRHRCRDHDQELSYNCRKTWRPRRFRIRICIAYVVAFRRVSPKSRDKNLRDPRTQEENDRNCRSRTGFGNTPNAGTTRVQDENRVRKGEQEKDRYDFEIPRAEK